MWELDIFLYLNKFGVWDRAQWLKINNFVVGIRTYNSSNQLPIIQVFGEHYKILRKHG